MFSDEFSRTQRNFIGQMGDRTWTAMDMYYSSDFSEEQNYKPEQVTIKNGALHLTMINETTDGKQRNPGCSVMVTFFVVILSSVSKHTGAGYRRLSGHHCTACWML